MPRSASSSSLFDPETRTGWGTRITGRSGCAGEGIPPGPLTPWCACYQPHTRAVASHFTSGSRTAVRGDDQSGIRRTGHR